MNEYSFYSHLIIGWLLLAPIVFTILFFFTAPYGRHSRKGWGPSFNNTLGWVLMEMGAPLLFAALFFAHRGPVNIVAFIFLGLWELHYLHRAFIYPFTIRGHTKHMSLTVLLFGFTFNLVNGYLNGRYLFTFSAGYPINWIADPRFILGITFIVLGFIVNRQADTILRNLRQPGANGYQIPYGSLFRWISCPNYFGEILIWTGWAVATWSLPGLAFALWTAANLVPRARAHHQWYRKHFANYPRERKALIPQIW